MQIKNYDMRILNIMLLLLCVIPIIGQTEKRLALLIGNNNYQNISILRSPYKDVDDMANALRNCGFEVMPIIKDGSKERIDKAVIEFSNKLKNYDVGMFYYSGHGAEVDGKNYIIPTDLPAGFSKEDIEYRCVNTDWLQNRMASSGAYNKTYIVVLDACRNNPFKSLSANKDILDANNWAPPTKIPSGTIVCYAASEGQTAADGGSTVNSPYTARFLKHMKVPNLAIESIFKRVRIELGAHEQKPQESTSLLTDFYFVKKDIPTNSTTTPPTDIRMVFIPGGSFVMGSNDGDEDEKPPHEVEIAPFYLGKYEVTVGEFRQFVNESGNVTDAEKNNNEGSYFFYDNEWNLVQGINWRYDENKNIRREDNYPVIHVSYNDALEYCKWLSKRHGKEYRLPTEAEWEYAAGNGRRHTKYSWGNDAPSGKNGGNLADESGAKVNNWTRIETNIFMNYDDGYAGIAPIAQFNSNDFGLYDMSGNVWEWTSSIKGVNRVLRGGSWNNNASGCRVSNRYDNSPGFRNYNLGFRLAASQ
jgi:formylglycine-generating enzyme required for sulfatase activity